MISNFSAAEPEEVDMAWMREEMRRVIDDLKSTC